MARRSAVRRRRAVVGTCLVVLVLVGYAGWAAYLAVFAGQGLVPPRSRDPELPADVRVISEDEECASGGCWRELLLQPRDGQSPEQLAVELGVAEETRSGWRPLDPHAVTVGSTAGDGTLRIYVRY